MKKLLKILFGILCLLTIGVAQAQFNYVGLIKDANGNPVSSQNLSMRISILDESQNIDYQESHTVSSSADGIVDLVIGNGTVISGLFSELDWSRTFYLKDEVDFGNGYVTMGIEAIKPVPLASYALNTVSATIRSDAYGNITLGDSNLLNRSVNESSIAIGNQALSNVRNTHPSWSPSDMPSSSIDESLFGAAGNIAIGAGAFASPQASTSTVTENAIGNVTIGHMSMYNAAKSTSANIALGTFTLPVIEEGGGNITMGWNGLFSLVKGSSNIAIGQNNMENSLEGNWNVSLGKSAMSNATYADGNTAIGNYALSNIGSTLDRLYSWTEDGVAYSQMNTAVGHSPLYSLTEGNFNTVVGALSLSNLTSGYRNVTLGYHTFYNLNGGDHNTAIGDGAGYETTGVVSRTTLIGATTRIASGVVNSTAIGHAANVTASNTIQLGDTNIELVNTSGIVSATAFVGDGSGLTNLPFAGLDQDGNVSITNSAPQFESTGTFNYSGNNVAIGDNALLNATSTAANIAIGANTLMNATTGIVSGSATSTGLNLAIGESAMVELQSGWVNQAIGSTALRNLTTGTANVAIGSGALEDLVEGEGNVAIGLDAIHQPTATGTVTTMENRDIKTSSYNTAVGYRAMYANTGASYNTAVGDEALFNVSYNANANVAMGSSSLRNNGVGWSNTAIGANALKNNTNSDRNTAIGSGAGQSIVNGDRLVFLGASSDVSSGTDHIQNSIVIGFGATVSTSHTIQLGNDDIEHVLTNGTISATAFVGDGSGLTNIGITNDLVDNNNNIQIGAGAFDNSSGQLNVVIGKDALKNSSGNSNTALGERSMMSSNNAPNSGSWNTALGAATLMTNTTGNQNLAAGAGALEGNTSGSSNVALGYLALQENTGDSNTAVGERSMMAENQNTGSWNTALGAATLMSNTSGTENLASGAGALEGNNTGSRNVALGFQAMGNNSTGAGNVAVGHHALVNMNGTGSVTPFSGFSYDASVDNTAIGTGAMMDNIRGSFNTAVGSYALQVNDTGFNNTALGLWTLNQNNNGVGNTAIGWGAMINTEDGSGNVALGSHSGQHLANNSSDNTFLGDRSGPTQSHSSTLIINATAIGANASVSSGGTVAIGDGNVTKWAFGLPTTDSGKALQVGSSSANGNGAYLTAGGVWTDASSILFKTNFIDLDNDWIKRQIAKLKIRRWDYKETDETHIGPTAEEFIDLFSVGIETDKQHLSTLDVAGVALKGVQAVIQENQELKEENTALEQQYQDLKELLTQVLQRIEKLEQQ